MSEKEKEKNRRTFELGGKKYSVDKTLEKSKGPLNKRYSKNDFKKEALEYFAKNVNKIETEEISIEGQSYNYLKGEGVITDSKDIGRTVSVLKDNKINKEIETMFETYLTLFGEKELKSFSSSLTVGILDNKKIKKDQTKIVPISQAIENKYKEVLRKQEIQRQLNHGSTITNLAAQFDHSSLKPVDSKISPSSSASLLNSNEQRLESAGNKKENIEMKLAIDNLTPSQQGKQIGD